MQTLILIGMVILSVLEADLYLASFPSIAEFFHASEDCIQSSLNIYLFVFAICVLLIGPLSDRFGRKRVFLSCLAIDCIGTIISLTSSISFLFLIGRALQAVGGCAGSVLSRVITKEYFPIEQSAKVMGYLFVGVSAAIAFSPIIGGILEEALGFHSVFSLILLFQIVLWLGVYQFIPETNCNLSASLNLPEVGLKFAEILKKKEFRFFCGLVSIIWASMYIFIGSSPFFIIEVFQMSPSEYGLIFAFMMGAMIIGNFMSDRLVRALGSKRAQILGIVTIGLGGISLVLLPKTYLLFCLSMSLYLFGTGVLLPLSQNEVSKGEKRHIGSLLSLFIFFQMFAASTMGFIFSKVAEPNAMPDCLTFLSALSIGIFFYYTLKSPASVRDPSSEDSSG